jgi:hypothetical protein
MRMAPKFHWLLFTVENQHGLRQTGVVGDSACQQAKVETLLIGRLQHWSHGALVNQKASVGPSISGISRVAMFGQEELMQELVHL